MWLQRHLFLCHTCISVDIGKTDPILNFWLILKLRKLLVIGMHDLLYHTVAYATVLEFLNVRTNQSAINIFHTNVMNLKIIRTQKTIWGKIILWWNSLLKDHSVRWTALDYEYSWLLTWIGYQWIWGWISWIQITQTWKKYCRHVT